MTDNRLQVSGHAALRRVLLSPSIHLLFVVIVIGSLVAGWLLNHYGVETVRHSMGRWAPLFTVPIHIIVALSPIPSDVVSIANGAVYGFVTGAALSWLAWWIAALMEFGIGCRVRADFDFEKHASRIPAWLRKFPVSHPVYLICGRQIPWLGGHITSFLPGASGVAWTRYLWCSAIAIIPGSLVMAAIGAGLMHR